MEKYIISVGMPTESLPKEYRESHTEKEIFNSFLETDYEIDKDVYFTNDKAEALEKFKDFRSSILIQKTNTGYETRYTIYELTTESGERIAVAPLVDS